MPLALETIEWRLRQTTGIRDVGWLTGADVGVVRRLETADAPGARNEGLLAVAGRPHVCAALSGPEFRHESAPCVQWVADGIVIGEEVTDPARRAGLLATPGVACLGANFFLYYDRMETVRGKAPRFVFRPLPFGELETCGGVRGVVSASPGAPADDYLKRRFEWPRGDAGLGTILIGFGLGGSP
jgi:hypothetical protein